MRCGNVVVLAASIGLLATSACDDVVIAPDIDPSLSSVAPFCYGFEATIYPGNPGKGTIAVNAAGGFNITGSNARDVIVGGPDADSIYGLDGLDRICALEGDDFVNGGAGGDRMQGGDGVNTLDYSTSPGGVHVNLNNRRGKLADAEGDRFYVFDNIRGSNFDDLLIGDFSMNRLIGLDGDDDVRGSQNHDFLDGGNGNDRLLGQEHDDSIFGGAGNDLIYPGDGTDIVMGDGDVDQVNYAASPTAIYVNFASVFRGRHGDASGDKWFDVENLVGSAFADTLIGNAHDNLINGGAGNDTINGGPGDDDLRGGDGDDVLAGDNDDTEAGADRLLGGDGNDVLRGYAGDDFLVGNAGDDALYGGAGDDQLRPTDGANTADGGPGTDWLNTVTCVDVIVDVETIVNTTGGCAAAVDLALSSVEAAAADLLADGISATTITVTTRNSSGGVMFLGGRAVVVSTSAGMLTDGTTSNTILAAIDQGDGTYTLTLIASASSETATVTATSDGNALADNAEVAFTIDVPDAEDDIVAGTSAPADAYHTPLNTPLIITDGVLDLLANDDVGLPAATLTHFGAVQCNNGAGVLTATDPATVTSSAAGVTLALAGVGGCTGGSLTVNADGTLTFTPTATYTGLFAFRYRIANGGGTSDAQVTLAVGVRAAATSSTYGTTLLGNVPINTVNSTGTTIDAGGDELVLAITGMTGGTASIAAARTYAFTPTLGFSGAASFTFTARNGFGTTAPATVSLTVGPRLWYINNTFFGQGSNGLRNTPLRCLMGASGCLSNIVTAAGDIIYVGTGNTSYGSPGTVALLDGQIIIGQGANQTFELASGGLWPADAGTAPATGGVAPGIQNNNPGDGITLAADNTLRGIILGGSEGFALKGTDFGTLTVGTDVVINTHRNGISLANGAISGDFGGVSTFGDYGVHLTNVTGSSNFGEGLLVSSVQTFFVDGGNGTFRYDGKVAGTGRPANISNMTGGGVEFTDTIESDASGISIRDNSGGAFVFSGIRKALSGTGTGTVVELSNNTGATIAFTNGGLVISSNIGKGITATGGGTIEVSGSGNTINTGSQGPLTVTNMTSPNGLTFANITSTTNGVNGILIDAFTGNLTVNGGTLDVKTGHVVSLSNITGTTTLNNMNIYDRYYPSMAIYGNNFGTLKTTNTSALGFTNAGGALSLTNGALAASFASLASSNGLYGVYLKDVTGTGSAGSTSSLGSSASSVFKVDGGSVDFTYNGHLTQGTNASLVEVAGGHTGTLTFQTGNISASNGTGLKFDNADGTYDFTGTVTLLSGGTLDVANGSSGSMTFSNTASEIFNPFNGALVRVNGSSADVTYAGKLLRTANSGRGVDVQNNTGGTITLSGAVKSMTASSTEGVRFSGNTGNTTLAFLNGGLVIANTSATGVFASNTNPANATLVIQGTGNSITTSSGAGLNVSGTTIGAGLPGEGGLNFERITSTLGVNGIALDNTGTTGSLRVYGNGSTCTSIAGTCSGGKIRFTTGAGILLSNTLSPSFNLIGIDDTDGSGIQGTRVNGFSFTNGSINLSGVFVIADESNIAFNATGTTTNNLAGAVTITGNRLSNASYHGIDIVNYDGTIFGATISDNTITSASVGNTFGSGIRLRALGSAGTVAHVLSADIDGNTITNFPAGGAILAYGGNPDNSGGGGTFGTPGSGSVISITDNLIAGHASDKMPNPAIDTRVSGRGQGSFVITGNGTSISPIRNLKSDGIRNAASGVAVVSSVIQNNFIAATHTATSGGSIYGINAFSGVAPGITGNGSLTTSILNNTISQTDGPGIYARAIEGSAAIVAKINSNIVSAPLGAGTSNGIRIESGAVSAVDNNVCVEMSGNTNAGENGAPGIGLFKQGTVSGTHDFRIEGMTPSPNTLASQVTALLNTNNPAGGTTQLLSAATGFTSCVVP